MAMLTIPHMPGALVIGACGLTASYVLMYGLWKMSSTTTSAYGVRIAGAAMLMLVLAGALDLFDTEPAASAHWMVNSALAVAALLVGGGAAWWRVRTAPPATLPQLATLFNGLGSGAAAIIVSIELFAHGGQGPTDLAVTLSAAWLAGISLTGSALAWAKLGGIVHLSWRPRGRRALLGALLLAAAAFGLCIVRLALGYGTPLIPIAEMEILIFGCGLACGILVIWPIRTIHMPVAVAILHALCAVSIALLGVLLRMPALTVVGVMAAGAGLRLAQLRAKSVNRNVVAAVLNDVGEASREPRTLDAADAAVFMNYARKIIVVPGYGLAAAQAQHKLHELIKRLAVAGVDVKVAQHPMAGRLPGQMQAILAEAHVADHFILPFPGSDDDFTCADIVLVIGANDIVNPSTHLSKSLPMFGMPFFNIAMARKIYVIKRGAGAGYSGTENPTFHGEHCTFIYGDAQTVLIKMVEALRVAEFPAAA